MGKIAGNVHHQRAHQFVRDRDRVGARRETRSAVPTLRACESRSSSARSDEDGARRRCRSSQDATLAAGASSGNADARAMVPFTGNLTWEALKRVNSIDDNERELILSMVGTVIYYPIAQNRDPDVIGPTLTSITPLPER
jgi:hypothetical protein